MNFSVLLGKMLIFVVLMAIGYILARRGSLTDDFARMGSKLALNVFLFATIVGSAVNAANDMSGRELFAALGVCLVTALLCYAIAFAVTRPFTKRDTCAVSELLIAAPNMMFIGVPVVQVMYGARGVLYLALSCLPFNILMYTYGVMRLSGSTGGRLRLRQLVTSPTVATLIAVLLLLLRIKLPDMLSDLIDTTAAATMPFSMVVIGASLGTLNVRGIFADARIYAVSLVRLIISPLLVYPLLSLFVHDPVLLGSMVMYSACPTATVVSILAMKYDNCTIYTSKGVLITTALSMLTIPIVVYILPL